jgi:hypothetical protein
VYINSAGACHHGLEIGLGATVHHMNEVTILSAATSTTITPRSLESEMELLHINRE